MPRTLSRLVATLALGVMLSGCALAVRRPSIAELQYDPGRYRDRTVAVEGVVTSAWGIGVLPGMYKVSDGTGEVTVLTRGNVPNKGARVQVKGRVNQVANLGGRSIGLHIQQTDLDFKRR